MEINSLLHKESYTTILQWIQQSRKPVFLYGPPGVGKTTLAHRVIKDAGLRAVECNASQFRHKAAMSDLIEPLLHSANVSDFFRKEGRRSLGIILDEIDGMSTGDRGGLTELVRILKDYKGPNIVICISNEWREKRYQPLIRISSCLNILAPDVKDCAAWIGKPIDEIKPLWDRHNGDLRKLFQNNLGNIKGNDIVRSYTVQDLVLRLLEGDLDIQDDIHLDNNDLNLAGLHLHETLPDWVREHYTDGWQIYYDSLTHIATSDRQDYYTFFHQHWSLFPLSFQSKLQAVNYRIFTKQKPTKKGKGWKFQYTSVLARQSWLFNQFKYLCELRDCLESVPQFREGGLELALWIASLLNTYGSDGSHLTSSGIVKENMLGQERAQRWLKNLVVPVVPPCPS